MGPWGCFCSSRSGGLEFVCLTGSRWYWCCWYGNHTLRTTAVGPGIIQSSFIFIISCCCMYNPLDPWIRLHSLKKLCPCLRITCSAVGTVLTERTPEFGVHRHTHTAYPAFYLIFLWLSFSCHFPSALSPSTHKKALRLNRLFMAKQEHKDLAWGKHQFTMKSHGLGGRLEGQAQQMGQAG